MSDNKASWIAYVLTNTNIKVVMRMNDPETCDHFANTFGTNTTTKVTDKIKDSSKTGDGTIREVERYNFHPNVFKKLGTGFGIISIPHRDGVRNLRIKFAMRENLPISRMPMIEKKPKILNFPKNAIEKTQPTEEDV